MKYLSRDPESWRKKEQEIAKREREKTQRYRRRGFYFLLLNLVAVFIFFFGIRSYYAQLSIEKAPPNQLLIQCEDTHSAGVPLDVQIRLYNNSEKRREIVISDFTFQIINSDKQQVYSFKQTQPVRSVFEPFTSRLLFDLKREKEITNLPSGEYVIHVEAIVDGKKVSAEKKFMSVERYELIVENFSDFYYVGENAQLKLFLVNQTSRVQDLRIDPVSVTLKHDGKIVWQNTVQVEPFWQNVKVGELIELIETLLVPFDKEGVYSLQLECVVNGSTNSLVLPVACINEAEKNLKKVKVYTDAPKIYNMRTPLQFSVYLLNESRDDVFLEIEEIIVSLLPTSLNFKKGPVRMWLAPYSKYEIFRFYPYSVSAITQPGNYRLLVKVATKNDRLDFETTLQVSE
ncbi:MAG: Uncharacterized protein XD58_0784 [Thermotoga sp. 50_1627]|nr:MAG: Uncharacterized protein XD45_0909 [Thermotoga sp. 50_64]KUK25276.1 MAG: Uncharacterized protein XD58_0784 [Thermotoga sp. 50_1627]MDK2922695.1 hypothetical protein [Pseudothermotoga sp.]HBT38669.1 hypothetical protein [Pseudothermotoga sp.]HCO98182.1 hypothetical protein [Pseudothermotoga sp.]